MTPAEHVHNLLVENSINVTWKHAGRSMAWRRSRKVSIRPVKTAITYAVALHEIGHILGKNPRLRLDQELAAWAWAKSTALFWTPVMEAKMNKCLASYERRAKRVVNMKISVSFETWMRGGGL